MSPEASPRFIADINVGKLAKWLRMIGYDTELFDHQDDKYLIHMAVTENRIILTRDTQIMQRRIVAIGELKAFLVTSDDPLKQIRQVISQFGLDPRLKPFSLCLECNRHLKKINKESVKDRVPPYVFQTQTQYMECLNCHRIYWQGTHWQAMLKKLEELNS